MKNSLFKMCSDFWKHTYKSQLLFVVGGFIAIGIALSFYQLYIHDSDKKTLLQTELQSYLYVAVRENPTIWDLRLQRFWATTVYDPILALPGTDTKKLAEAMKSLQESQEDYLHFYEKDEQELIRSTIHPFEFLALLPTLESARVSLVENPTFRNAILYSKVQRKTLKLQKKYTAKLSNVFLLLERKNFDSAFLPGTTSDIYIAQVLARMHSIIDTQIEEVANRKRCLLGWRGATSCEINFPQIILVSKASPTFLEFASLRTGNALKEYIHKDRTRYSPTAKASQDLPLIHIPEAACTRTKPATYAFTWRKSLRSGSVGLWASPSSEFMFHDIRRRETAFQEALANAEVAYEFQPMNPYFCIDNSFDTGNIRTAYYIQNELFENPIFTKGTQHTREHLFKLEQELVAQTTILHIPTVETYIAEIQKLLYINSGTLTEEFAPEEIVRMLEMVTVWRSQTAWFSSEIIRLESMAATSTYVLKTMHVPISALFLTRSYFSTLLLVNNTTLYKKRISFLETITPIDISKAGLVNYSDFLSKTVSLKKLPSFMRAEDEKALEVYLR